ncbi:MAG: hypothetical protein K0U16_07405 [Gammaproteobacteria bacterium]|nr:hypothetical protein [Gammaproteobacteria bacterium]
MALSPRVKFALALGGTVVAVGGGVLLWKHLQRPKPPPEFPALLCPKHVGREAAPSASLTPGDFVVVQLQSPDGTFSEATWATVVGIADPQLVVVLSGEQIPEGVRPLNTEKHGFRLGQRLILDRDCVWEVFRPAEFTGQIMCGPQIRELAKVLEDETLFPVRGGLIVQQGDRAQILVASQEAQGTSWNERLWTRIINVSPSGQIITAKVEGEPELTERHELSPGSVVRFNRDCVIGV